MKDQLGTLDVPHPLHTFEHGRDPEYGYGTALYSSRGVFRCQVTRRFDGGPLRADRASTLVVLGVCPGPRDNTDHDGPHLDTLDDWLIPYADAAKETGFAQLFAMCLFGIRNPAVFDNPTVNPHLLHGEMNSFFTSDVYLAELAATVAVAIPDDYRPCPECQESTTPRPVADLEEHQPGVSLVRLAPNGRTPEGDVWLPYRLPTLRLMAARS